MRKIKPLALAFILLALIGCHAPVSRKVIVMGRGKIVVGENKIDMKDGTGYAEETVEIEGTKPTQWQVTTSTGKKTVNIPEEKGVYILNLKTDTIIGSRQTLGNDISNSKGITQEELKIKIDSLTLLTKGDNVHLGGRNYFIIPGQIIKVSPNIEAKVFGPFTLISHKLEMDSGNNIPEIYKFYTNTEMRQLIGKFVKMTK